MSKEFFDKLVDIQTRLKAPKNQFNNFGKYKYRSQEDILEAVKPLLAEHGLVLTLSDTVDVFLDRVYVKATATVTDGDTSISTIAYAREELTKKGMDGSQITGTASSYARKYALNGLFLIDDTKDADVPLPNPKAEVEGLPQISDADYRALQTQFMAAAKSKDISAKDYLKLVQDSLGFELSPQMTSEQLTQAKSFLAEHA